ncbi:MAG: tRNA-dihydrouridine synthase family protein [Lachnospiraceae bacterium]|nr:tRNA-dihydrouridine synthase family protein [Lachnospiraceae bacterium]
MEGITGRIFRRAYEESFPGRVDTYFAPFIASGVKKGVAGKDLRELLPEDNEGYTLIPQLLTNSVEDFENTAGVLKSMGYKNINLNLGCPSQTVVSKGRGAGMLADLPRLERFLTGAYDYCEKSGISLSLKTRLGLVEEEEFAPLLKLYNRFPVHELIIHTRLRNDYYKLPCRPEQYAFAYENAEMPLVYNGDILCAADVEKVSSCYPGTKAVMIGRGFLKKPWMLDHDDDQACYARMWTFHDRILELYREEMSGETPVLFKMKELWSYLGETMEQINPESKKQLKVIRKSRSIAEYYAATRIIRNSI